MKATILCVDDEHIVRTSLKEQLRRAFGKDYRVEVVENAEAALEVFADIRDAGADLPVAIVDQIMPGLKGHELLRQLHSRDPEMRKILLTGQASAEAVGYAVNHASLYRYIAKPWEQEDLNLTVQEALRSYYSHKRLDEQNRELVALNEDLEGKIKAFFRFVPREFLRLLGQGEAYEEVALGMGVDLDMAILFTDIRDFTTVCEGMSPAECVRFINEYIAYMDAPVGDNEGFFEGFAGDGIMALFDQGADRAVRAGIGMARALETLNVKRQKEGRVPIRTGVGVNAGRITLGTLGGPLRLKCGVAGDAVNLASRVEGLTKVYDSHMLITHHVVERLAEPTKYGLRQVDHVRVRGRSAPVGLYEVVDAEPEPLAALKRETLERYRRAVAFYYAAEFTEAGRLFAECLVSNPSDRAVLTYLSRCRRYMTEGVTDDWKGIEPPSQA